MVEAKADVLPYCLFDDAGGGGGGTAGGGGGGGGGSGTFRLPTLEELQRATVGGWVGVGGGRKRVCVFATPRHGTARPCMES